MNQKNLTITVRFFIFSTVSRSEIATHYIFVYRYSGKKKL